MTPKHYFYTDPLAAAWMAKQLGMLFTCRDADLKLTVDKDYQKLLSHDLAINGLIYVHPNSLHLLEPRVGDVLRLYFYTPEEDDKAGAVMTGFYAGGGEAITWFRSPRDGGIEKEVHKIADHQWRIIQRDGKPFMWPESEEI